jgi:hypothetical protein
MALFLTIATTPKLREALGNRHYRTHKVRNRGTLKFSKDVPKKL